jgi:serine/threonine-protein kinase
MICNICDTPIPEDSRFCLVCGADLSDPEVSTRQRAAVKELFEAIKIALQGRYTVTDILGRGGMGAVFLAEDVRLGRKVAIKVLRPELADEPGFLGRFEREARFSAQLDHPNIIPIYEVAREGTWHYFVMKYVAGKSLDELLAGKPMPPDQARSILWQAACGLGHAHSRGVVHRDVKPSNIMIDPAGRVMITDFGISKALQATTQYTSTGQIVGTPKYVSPEQAQGIPLDGRSDQYSLAVVAYQMLVGRLPLMAETVHVLLYKHIYETPVPAASVLPTVPPVISEAIQRALAKEPNERFPTMEEFATALWPERPVRPGELEPVLRGNDLHASTPAAAFGMTRKRRRRLALAAGAVALVLLGVALATLTSRQAGPESASVIVPSAPSGDVPESTTVPDASIQPLPPPPSPAPAAQPAPAPEQPKDTVETPRPPVRRKSSRPAPTVAPAPVAPTPPAPKFGYLTINAVPYGTVSIDGVLVGDTPVVRREVEPGEHRIVISREGFRTDSTTATISAGNEVRIRRTLVKATE